MNTLAAIPVSLQTIVLLVASNVFMTMAWYGHLDFLWASLCMVGAVYFMFRGD